MLDQESDNCQLGWSKMLRKKGFTLIEFITVLIITVIIARSVQMILPTSSNYYLSTATEQLKRDIRYTQILALSLNTSYTITILAGSYSISPTPPAGAVSVTMPTGVTLTPATLTYSLMGDPSLSSNLVITISVTGASNTLTISPETGYVDG
jgi:MSHA pilin protein MshC